MTGFWIALLSGALMSVQGVFNTEVTKNSSMWVTNSWVQFTVEKKYMLLGGVIGAFITWSVIQSMSGLGPAKAVMMIVISQLVVAYLIELFGLFGVEKAAFEWRKLIGTAVMIVGIVIFKWESQR